jgi:hypothetical protein
VKEDGSLPRTPRQPLFGPLTSISAVSPSGSLSPLRRFAVATPKQAKAAGTVSIAGTPFDHLIYHFVLT